MLIITDFGIWLVRYGPIPDEKYIMIDMGLAAMFPEKFHPCESPPPTTAVTKIDYVKNVHMAFNLILIRALTEKSLGLVREQIRKKILENIETNTWSFLLSIFKNEIDTAVLSRYDRSIFYIDTFDRTPFTFDMDYLNKACESYRIKVLLNWLKNM